MSRFLKTSDDSQTARGDYKYEEEGQQDMDRDLCLWLYTWLSPSACMKATLSQCSNVPLQAAVCSGIEKMTSSNSRFDQV